MRFGFHGTFVAIAVAACLGAGAARAGDDGAAPLWEGIGSVVSPLIGFGGKEEKPPIEYREHGKIVVPKSMDLPEPGAAATSGDWPVDQEIQRKKIAKQKEKDQIAGVGDARLRYTHPFPNAPVTVGASDPAEEAGGEKAASSTPLEYLNPLGWVGLGKSPTSLGPEPDREWLTDPPKGYRAPSTAAPAPAARPAPAGQASN
jgi:hypothetical protein